jgi:hypothetical protein
LRSAREFGTRTAAPTPCEALATIKIAVVDASAQASDAAVKIAKPATKIVFAPTRSPNAPAVKIKAANAIV